MKTRFISLLSVITLASVLMAQAPVGQGQTPSAPGVQRGKGERREKHPEMRAALRACENALQRLNKADRDFGGHRSNAVKLIQQAITEIKAGIAYDKN